MRIFLSILMCALAMPVHAVELKEFADPPAQLLPIDASAPNIPCEEVLPALLKFKDMNRQHEDSVVAFLTQAVEKINGWYETLFPLEGQQKTIEAGTFEPILSGGEKMSMVIDYSYDNTALLAQELDRIIISMRECNIQKR